jgi:pimeloyl-ACP methyl ester carboxylesterase
VGLRQAPSRRLAAALGNLDLVWVDPALYDAFISAGERGRGDHVRPARPRLSDPVDHVPTLEERAADLAAVMDTGGFETATIFAIFDACLGAFVVAARHPERVDGLVFWNPFAYDRAGKDVHLRWGKGESLSMQRSVVADERDILALRCRRRVAVVIRIRR